SLFHPDAQRPRAGRDRFEVIRRKRRHRRAHRSLALERLQGPLERGSSHHISGRHGEPGALELPQTAALAADVLPIAEPDLIEPGDVRAGTHEARYERSVTTPRPPSTRMRWPSFIREVAFPVPTTAGRPNSRATMAAWLIEPPMSDTAPAIFWKIGAQVGLVIWQTRMSPLPTRQSPPGVPRRSAASAPVPAAASRSTRPS